MRYRSKPTEIEAYQLTDESIAAHLIDDAPLPGVRVTSADFNRKDRKVWRSVQRVRTIQGQEVYVKPGEWIVQESDGVHHYPIADDVFRQKYEPTN